MNYPLIFHSSTYQSLSEALGIPSYPQVNSSLSPVEVGASNDTCTAEASSELWSNPLAGNPSQEPPSTWDGVLSMEYMAELQAHAHAPNNNRLDFCTTELRSQHDQLPHNILLDYTMPMSESIDASQTSCQNPGPEKSYSTDWEVVQTSRAILHTPHSNSVWSNHNEPEVAVKQNPEELDDSFASCYHYSLPFEFSSDSAQPISRELHPYLFNTQSQLQPAEPTPYTPPPPAATLPLYPPEPVANALYTPVQHPITSHNANKYATPFANDDSCAPLYRAAVEHDVDIFGRVAQRAIHFQPPESQRSTFSYPDTQIVANVPIIPSTVPPEWTLLSATSPSSNHITLPSNAPPPPTLRFKYVSIPSRVTPTKKPSHSSKKDVIVGQTPPLPPAASSSSSSSSSEPSERYRLANGRILASHDLLIKYYSPNNHCQLCFSRTKHKRYERKLDHLVSYHIFQVVKYVKHYDEVDFWNKLNKHGQPAHLVVTEEQFKYARSVLETLKCSICDIESDGDVETSLVFRGDIMREHLEVMHEGLEKERWDAEMNKLKTLELSRELWYNFHDRVLFELPPLPS